jgi:hypothetical protein
MSGTNEPAATPPRPSGPRPIRLPRRETWMELAGRRMREKAKRRKP